MAVAIDIGETMDIHPRNKRDVGYRLAQWALATTYGRPVVASGPLYTHMTVEQNRIRVYFRNAGGGLAAKGGELKTFAIAGAERQFRLAKAVIDGATVVVGHPDVCAPMAVRYAWADNPEGCNLYNAEGLPASPFRTDTW
jgi:sialate O-acetylesterase